MMAAELRSPHQRRSDHLSILTRRQPPPQSPGRFAKTFTETAACAIGTFDPAFDSDADTEGPASGSSVWRREFSRVISGSSGASAAISSMDHPEFAAAVAAATAASVEVDAVAAASDISAPTDIVQTNPVSTPVIVPPPREHLAVSDTAPVREHVWAPPPGPNPHEQLTKSALSSEPPDSFDSDIVYIQEEDDISTGVFSRERGRSFYGHEGEARVEDEEMSSHDHLGPLSKAQLRTVLDDDYELFYSPQVGGENDRKPEAAQVVSSSPSAASGGILEASPCRTDSTSPTSPILEKEDADAVCAHSEPEREADRPVLKPLKSVESAFDAAVASGERVSVDTTGRVKSYKVFSENEDISVSIVSDDSDLMPSTDADGLRLTGDEINVLLRDAVQRPRLSSGTVPLFVEEAGRIPRAAIVNGKVQRVKVSKTGGSSLRTGRQKTFNVCAVETWSRCLARGSDADKSNQKRRKSRRRRKKGSRSGKSHSAARRSFAARMGNA